MRALMFVSFSFQVSGFKSVLRFTCVIAAFARQNCSEKDAKSQRNPFAKAHLTIFKTSQKLVALHGRFEA